MNTVYILGAGATHASQNEKGGIKNPLDSGDAGFWKAVEELNLLDENSYLYRFLLITYGENFKKHGMEEVYTFVDNCISFVSMNQTGPIDFFDFRDSSDRLISLMRHTEDILELKQLIDRYIHEKGRFLHSQTSYNHLMFYTHIEQELINLIYRVFSSTNNHWHCELHAEFAKKILPTKDKATIISFNYDLLIDNALISAGLTPNDSFSYYFWLHQFHSISPKEELGIKTIATIPRSPQVPSDKLELLKLHGSLNWFILSDAIANENREAFYANPELLNGLIPETTYNYAHTADGKKYNYHLYNLRLNRVLISPIIEKVKKFKTWFNFESLWQRALAKIAVADRIVFIGYSMPPADYLANWLFRMGYILNKNKADLQITIVNPDEDHQFELKIKKIFVDSKHTTSLPGFEEYVKSL